MTRGSRGRPASPRGAPEQRSAALRLAVVVAREVGGALAARLAPTWLALLFVLVQVWTIVPWDRVVAVLAGPPLRTGALGVGLVAAWQLSWGGALRALLVERPALRPWWRSGLSDRVRGLALAPVLLAAGLPVVVAGVLWPAMGSTLLWRAEVCVFLGAFAAGQPAGPLRRRRGAPRRRRLPWPVAGVVNLVAFGAVAAGLALVEGAARAAGVPAILPLVGAPLLLAVGPLHAWACGASEVGDPTAGGRRARVGGDVRSSVPAPLPVRADGDVRSSVPAPLPVRASPPSPAEVPAAHAPVPASAPSRSGSPAAHAPVRASPPSPAEVPAAHAPVRASPPSPAEVPAAHAPVPESAPSRARSPAAHAPVGRIPAILQWMRPRGPVAALLRRDLLYLRREARDLVYGAFAPVLPLTVLIVGLRVNGGLDPAALGVALAVAACVVAPLGGAALARLRVGLADQWFVRRWPPGAPARAASLLLVALSTFLPTGAALAAATPHAGAGGLGAMTLAATTCAAGAVLLATGRRPLVLGWHLGWSLGVLLLCLWGTAPARLVQAGCALAALVTAAWRLDRAPRGGPR